MVPELLPALRHLVLEVIIMKSHSFKWKKNDGADLCEQKLSSSAAVLQVTPRVPSLYSHNFVRVSEGQRVEGSCQNLVRRSLTSLSCKANCRGKARASEKMFCLSLFLVICSVF